MLLFYKLPSDTECIYYYAPQSRIEGAYSYHFVENQSSQGEKNIQPIQDLKLEPLALRANPPLTQSTVLTVYFPYLFPPPHTHIGNNVAMSDGRTDGHSDGPVKNITPSTTLLCGV